MRAWWILSILLLAAVAGEPAWAGPCTPTAEVCDGVDNDCNGQIDDDVPQVGAVCNLSCGQGVVTCQGASGLVCEGPPPIEICDDQVDNDCDGEVDESSTEVCDGVDNDCDTLVDEELEGVAETCNDLDDDCDGEIDEILCGDPIDVDGNGQVEALTDILLLLRWRFGFTGNVMTNGAVAQNCKRCTGAAIIEHIELHLLASP